MKLFTSITGAKIPKGTNLRVALKVMYDFHKKLAIPFYFYTLSFGLCFVFPNSYFWDDWINYFGKTATQIRNSTGPFSGFSPIRIRFEAWMAQSWPSGFRILTFFLFLIAALALLEIVRNSSLFQTDEAAVIFSLFLLAPVNSARHSMTIFMYSASYAFFFVGWWMYKSKTYLMLRIIGLLFFLLSFDTASLIFFVLVPIGMELLEELHTTKSVSHWLRFSLPLVVAALGFWIIEPKINPMLDPIRAEYYRIKISGVVRSLVLVAVPALLLLLGKFRYQWKYTTHRGQLQSIFGVLTVWIGIFPYMSLGHFANLESMLIAFVPGQSDWDSRHQLLMPLGLAFIVIGLMNMLNLKNITRLVIPVLMVYSILNFSFTQEYLLDSIKTEALARKIQATPELGKFKLLLVDDQTLRFNARGRSIRSYEWDALFSKSRSQSHPKSEIYRYVDCKNVRPDGILTITAQRGRLSTLIFRDPKIIFSITDSTVCG